MDPGAYLGSLEPVGWRFGLDRIQRLLFALGMPQRGYASVHVVGTNGKSSVTTMTAALLEATGTTTGAYLSPHADRWSERVRLRGSEIQAADFAEAVERVAAAVPAVERGLEDGDAVTQFEAITAAALLAFATAGVKVAVVEAGLGGRLDATNVLPSKVTALTSIGLEHTQYLGDTVAEIAAEKLAVLRDHSTLVVGRLEPEVLALAREAAAEHSAEIIEASEPAEGAGLAPYLRRNLGVAVAAAEAVAGPLDPATVAEVAASLPLPGRMQLVGSDPPLILDAAHNPDGARAVAEALPERSGGRPVVACIAILADKDAAGVIGALAPALEAVVCSEIPAERLVGSGRPGTEVVPAAELAALARSAGIELVEEVPQPEAGIARAQELARERGGVALAAGSHYLLGYGS